MDLEIEKIRLGESFSFYFDMMPVICINLLLSIEHSL